MTGAKTAGPDVAEGAGVNDKLMEKSASPKSKSAPSSSSFGNRVGKGVTGIDTAGPDVKVGLEVGGLVTTMY